MDPVLIIVLVVVGIVLIAAVAYGLYRAGFTVDKLKVKTGLVEMEASREKQQAEKEVGVAGPKIRQRATEGGAIRESGITAPADSEADIDQQAKGEESEIDDSPIRVK